MIIAKVIGIFIFVLIGYVSTKVGWLPASASKHLSVIVLHIAAPCMAVTTMSETELSPEKITAILMMFLITIIGLMASMLIGILYNKITRVPAADHGVYITAFMFTNNGFMGFAISFTLFGNEGLFLMLMIGCMTVIFLYSLGIVIAKRDAAAKTGQATKKNSLKNTLKEIINVPIVGAIIGLTVFFTQIPIPDFLADILRSLGSLMTPLAMMVVGMQLTESNPRNMICNLHTVLTIIMRLILIPGLFFIVMSLFNMPDIWLAILTLNFLLPASAVIPSIFEQNGANSVRAAELTFLTTMFSIATLPVATVLLQML